MITEERTKEQLRQFLKTYELQLPITLRYISSQQEATGQPVQVDLPELLKSYVSDHYQTDLRAHRPFYKAITF